MADAPPSPLGGAAVLPRGVGRTDQRAEACSALGPATPEALLRLMLDQEPVLGVLARQERTLGTAPPAR